VRLLGDANHIDWTAGIKEKIVFFIVQRSKDGKHFVPLAMIHKKDETNFSFLDNKTENKKWFYRIIKVDQFGDGVISESIFID